MVVNKLGIDLLIDPLYAAITLIIHCSLNYLLSELLYTTSIQARFYVNILHIIHNL